MVKDWLEHLKTSYAEENNRLVKNLPFPSLNRNKIRLLVLSVFCLELCAKVCLMKITWSIDLTIYLPIYLIWNSIWNLSN